MEDKLKIAVILGTKREGRISEHAAQWVAAKGREQEGVEIIFVDPRDFTLPPDGAPEDGTDPRYSAITAQADAFFIVTPEYNHSFPSSLKRLLDSEFKNYFHKPVALAGVSNGPWGGTRAVEALLPVMRALGLAPSRLNLYFPKAQEIFDETGAMKPEYAETYNKSVQGMYDDLIWLARALKAARAQ
ncbi:MAG TPA: NAD(P)H-dependent oxidoreductase [Patescibacteria group bacterium]|nr:NAD(P)H-dependent oxidoreductase [Patescibacteria group bacterium]